MVIGWQATPVSIPKYPNNPLVLDLRQPPHSCSEVPQPGLHGLGAISALYLSEYILLTRQQTLSIPLLPHRSLPCATLATT